MTAGYVLAGGRSVRMGRDKAWVELAGRPLIAWAVGKLRLVCDEVFILSGEAGLGEFAPVVRDVHPGCGPLGGMEAALLHTRCEWNVFLPVDVPFVRAEWLRAGDGPVRLRMFRAEGRMQPTVCMLHREVLPYVAEAVSRGELKVLPALERAGRELARGLGVAFEAVFEVIDTEPGDWFANLNTPEDLAAAEIRLQLLDTLVDGSHRIG